jgi:endonuclease/exonuclease/phosphatase (EEP) superfamily protein YafD
MKLIKPSLLILGTLGAALPHSAIAESYVYLTNNTEQTIYLNIEQSGASLTKGEHWWQHATKVEPLATVKFMEMNRDSGIKWGKDYYFNTQVSMPSGDSFNIKQQLTGTWNFSDLSQAANNSAYYDDRNIHSVNTNVAGLNAKLAFKAQAARVNGDDIYYVIHPDKSTPSIGDSSQLNVLAYNVWALLPGLVSRSVSERLTLLKDKLDGYDAIVLSELFDNSNRETLLNALKTQYPYQTNVVDRWGALEDGGVVIISRWPIESEKQITYQQCDSDDCSAAKGVMYAGINKQGQKYHLFGSHTQAWDKPQNQATRASQFSEMKNFIDAQNITTDEAVIIAGDLNVDRAKFPQEYNAMLSTLNAKEVTRVNSYKYTADGQVNAWTDSKPEVLDYVLYSNAHKQPKTQAAKVIAPRSIDSSVFLKYDLSDHFAIQGIMSF